MKALLIGVAVLTFAGVILAQAPQTAETEVAGGLVPEGPYKLVGPRNLLTDFPASTPEGAINVVVEIPAGTTAKWEVEKSDGSLRWEFKNGKPRQVEYLGYPGNYGMVPRTLLPKELGGDGDPVDVLVLRPAVARGEVVEARLVGVLKLVDDGEKDDKLLAVLSDTPLGMATNLQELSAGFPGVTTIVETWFTSYKGPGEIESQGFAGVLEARRVLKAASEAFEVSRP